MMLCVSKPVFYLYIYQPLKILSVICYKYKAMLNGCYSNKQVKVIMGGCAGLSEANLLFCIPPDNTRN